MFFCVFFLCFFGCFRRFVLQYRIPSFPYKCSGGNQLHAKGVRVYQSLNIFIVFFNGFFPFVFRSFHLRGRFPLERGEEIMYYWRDLGLQVGSIRAGLQGKNHWAATSGFQPLPPVVGWYGVTQQVLFWEAKYHPLFSSQSNTRISQILLVAHHGCLASL